jgi:multiple sugar transport system substrate-binding protein
MTEVFLQPDQRPRHADVFVRAAESSRPSEATRTANAFWFDVFTSFTDEIWRGERTAADVFPKLKPRIDAALRTHNEEP